jgi:hypothetical protein
LDSLAAVDIKLTTYLTTKLTELVKSSLSKEGFEHLPMPKPTAPSAKLLVVVAAGLALSKPSLCFLPSPPLRPPSSGSKRCLSLKESYQIRRRIRLSQLNLLNNGKSKEPDKKLSAVQMKQDEKPKKSATGHIVDDEEDELGFSSFLQRMSQWPLDQDPSKDKKLSSTPVAEDSRNPFLSPFSNLLNFEEIITAKGKDIPDGKALNKKDMDEINAWGSFVATLKQSFGDPFGNQTINAASTPASIVKGASKSVESVLSAASTAVSPDVFSSVIKQARHVLKFQDDLVAAAKTVARESGLDDAEAAERARNTTNYVADLVSVADQVLRFGYVRKEENAAIADRKRRKEEAEQFLDDSLPASSGTLFDKIPSARAISYDEYGPAISTLAEMGWLSGGIYENQVERPHELGHSIVAEGISADVYWMVTDSMENEDDFKEADDGNKGNDIPVRTFIVRGFDASDERVDREKLFTEICNLQSVPFAEKYPGVLVHAGLYGLAKEIYKDIKKYIDWSAPAQKIVFTGHSVGGSLSILLILMLARDRGGM